MKFFLILCLVTSVSAFAQSGADAETSSNPSNAPTSMENGSMNSNSTMPETEQRMEDVKEERINDFKTEEEKLKKNTESTDMNTVPSTNPAPSTTPAPTSP